MLPFGVTIPATVPQRSEIPEGLTNYPVYIAYSEVKFKSLFLATYFVQFLAPLQHELFWKLGILI